eukprot:243905-Pleurochrysis_carterae.AAC.1
MCIRDRHWPVHELVFGETAAVEAPVETAAKVQELGGEVGRGGSAVEMAEGSSAGEAELAARAVSKWVDGLLGMVAERIASAPLQSQSVSERSALHGPLVALRFIFADLESSGFHQDAVWQPYLRDWLARVLTKCDEVSVMALGVISTPAPEGLHASGGDGDDDGDGAEKRAQPDPMSFPQVASPHFELGQDS